MCVCESERERPGEASNLGVLSHSVVNRRERGSRCLEIRLVFKSELSMSYEFGKQSGFF